MIIRGKDYHRVLFLRLLGGSNGDFARSEAATARISGARDKVAKKTYIRATRFPNPGLDKALADCKADPSWRVVETNIPGHVIMLDASHPTQTHVAEQTGRPRSQDL